MKRNHARWLLILVILVTLNGCTRNRPEPTQAPEGQPPVAQPATNTPVPQPTPVIADDYTAPGTATSVVFVPGTLLVKFRAEEVPRLPIDKEENLQGLSIGSPALDPAFQQLGITSLEPILAPVAQAMGISTANLNTQAGDLSRLYVAEFDPSQDASAVAANLSNNPGVEYAEPNFVASITGEPRFAPPTFAPNDPFYEFQWHFQKIQMPQAWDLSAGANITIAVLDTGIAYENFESFQQAPDLAGTRFFPGFDFVNQDNHANDDHGHGTHVAGTLAQTTNNNLGIAGVAFNAHLLPVKVLDARGQGSYEAIIQGVSFAVGNGARIINLSLSGNSPSQALEEAVNSAKNRGVTVISAAGNNSGPVGYPAAYGSVIAVGSIRFDDTLAPYSSRGPQIDLVAPGGDNRVDQNSDGFGDGVLQQTFKAGEINNFRFLFFEGTSMASPHVAGTAALLLSRRSDLNPDQIREFLIRTTRDLGQSGRDDLYGHGLLQAFNALIALDEGLPPITPTPVTPTTEPPTPIPTTPSPAGNIIVNPSFETDEAWVFPRTDTPGSYSNAVVHSGARAALVGITDPNKDRHSFSSVAQKVTIPADAATATLTAYIYPITGNAGSRDLQIISILNQNFREIKRLHNGLGNENAWIQKTFDVTQFKGRTIYVYFDVVNRSKDGRITSMYVDDVTLEITR